MLPFSGVHTSRAAQTLRDGSTPEGQRACGPQTSSAIPQCRRGSLGPLTLHLRPHGGIQQKALGHWLSPWGPWSPRGPLGTAMANPGGGWTTLLLAVLYDGQLHTICLEGRAVSRPLQVQWVLLLNMGLSGH